MVLTPSLSREYWKSSSTETTIQAVGASTFDRSSPDAAIQALEKTTRKAFDDFAETVGEIPSVEQIRGQVAGAYLHLVTYVSQSRETERFQIYEAEKKIFAAYPHLRFEFDLVDRRGYALDAAEIKGKYIKTIRELPSIPYEIQ